MKKLALTALTLMTTVGAYALPLGNPWEASLLTEGLVCPGNCSQCCDPCSNWADSWNLRYGFYGDYVFDKHMKIDDNVIQGTTHRTELYTNAGYIALNFCNRYDLFATLGGTEIKIEKRNLFNIGETTPSYINVPLYLETDTHFSWSVGARGTIWECGCFGIGAEAQYFQTRPNLNFVRTYGEDSIVYFQGSDWLTYREWQLGLGAAYRVNIGWCSTALVPYVGVKYGRSRISLDEVFLPAPFSRDVFADLENSEDWGYAVGLTLVGCNAISVTVEGRFANEKAVYVNSQFRF